MAPKYRAQILLEPEQHQALQQIASREGKSISEVARDIIQLGLDVFERDTNAIQKQRSQALEQLTQMRHEIQEKHGIYAGNLIEEARLERESQLDETQQAGTEL